MQSYFSTIFVRNSVEETLNILLDKETDELLLTINLIFVVDQTIKMRRKGECQLQWIRYIISENCFTNRIRTFLKQVYEANFINNANRTATDGMPSFNLTKGTEMKAGITDSVSPLHPCIDQIGFLYPLLLPHNIYIHLYIYAEIA